VWLQLPESIRTGFGEPFCERCIASGVLYVPGEICYPREYSQIPRSALRLSFGAQTIAKIDEGIARLASVIGEFLDRPGKKKS
jgi:2-aminoadipate transaminase